MLSTRRLDSIFDGKMEGGNTIKNVIVYGASGQGKTAADVIEKQGEYHVLGFIDDHIELGREIYGYRVLGDERALLSPKIYGGVVAIGDNYIRSQVVDKIVSLRPDFIFIRAIHPTVVISRGAEIGEGALILALCSISTETRLGRHCYMASQGVAGHESLIGDFVNMSNHCSVSGRGRVGSYSSLGPGVTVLQGVTVGEHTMIGANSTVTRDIEPRVIAYGSPCKVIRKRKVGEKYL